MSARTRALRRYTWLLPLLAACAAATAAAQSVTVTIDPDTITCRTSFEEQDTIVLPKIATRSMTHAVDTIDLQLRGKTVTVKLQRYIDAGYALDRTLAPGRHVHKAKFAVDLVESAKLEASGYLQDTTVVVTFAPAEFTSDLTTNPAGMNAIVSDETFNRVKQRIPTEADTLHERVAATIRQTIHLPLTRAERLTLLKKPGVPIRKPAELTVCGQPVPVEIHIQPPSDIPGEDWTRNP